MTSEFSMPVELGKTREFATATGSNHPMHMQADNAVTPPTFLMAASFWQTPESDPLPADRDLTRLLHAGQEFIFPKGPPRVGAQLTGLGRIAECYTKEGRRGGSLTFTVLVTEYRDAAGELVAEVRNTVVETSTAVGTGE
jgi:hypothetical protein